MKCVRHRLQPRMAVKATPQCLRCFRMFLACWVALPM